MNLIIQTQNFTITSDLTSYLQQKMSKLQYTAFFPEKDSHILTITLVETLSQKYNKYACKAEFTINNSNIVVEEASINMYASIDIVIARLKTLIMGRISSVSSDLPETSSKLRRWLTEQRGTF